MGRLEVYLRLIFPRHPVRHNTIQPKQIPLGQVRQMITYSETFVEESLVIDRRNGRENFFETQQQMSTTNICIWYSGGNWITSDYKCMWHSNKLVESAE